MIVKDGEYPYHVKLKSGKGSKIENLVMAKENTFYTRREVFNVSLMKILRA